tara:strand:- start:6052 stop:6423 length:372 start_codon:yes stop_codon:yes gene_type:complete
VLSALRKLIPAWVWVALLVLGLTAAGGFWVVHLVQSREAAEGQLAALEANRDRWQQRTMEALAQLGDERARARDAEAAVAALQAALDAREPSYRAARKRIEQATPAEDGEVAPVLRQALEDLP